LTDGELDVRAAKLVAKARPERVRVGCHTALNRAVQRNELDKSWQEQMMKFRSYVEPPEPMRGLEVPPEVVEALGGGKRPAVTITINGHSWRSRVAVMRGRYLLGLSNANRKAAGVVTGDEVEVEVEIDADPRVVVEPADFARDLDADPIARTAYDRLSYSRKREHVLAIDSVKKPETRIRLVEKALAMLRNPGSEEGRAARAKIRGDHL
jgi:Domain of unknown function (DUF1905)/Bacteriocin-protection, YdeI or OmpD-Associated